MFSSEQRNGERADESRAEERREAASTHKFVRVGVLVLGLIRGWDLTVWAVVLTVVEGGAVICYNHQLLDISLETHRKQEVIRPEQKVLMDIKNQTNEEITLK